MKRSKQRERIAIWGASGHALVVADILCRAGTFEIAGYIDDANPDRQGEPFAESRIFNADRLWQTLRQEGVEKIALAIGDCDARLQKAQLAAQNGFELLNGVAHPSAVIAPGVTLGKGTVVAAASVVNPKAVIGDCVIINTGASVDHECHIGDGVHVGPGTRMGGCVSVGPGTWLGIGAIIRDRVQIGSRSIVGAGAVVLSDLPDGIVAYGCPAKVARQNVPREKEEKHGKY